MNSTTRIDNILRYMRSNYLVLLEGRLKNTEEAALIRETMNMIHQDLDLFSGIEISILHSEPSNNTLFQKLRFGLAKVLIGDNYGMTLIGPASMIKELRRDSENLEIYFQKTFLEEMIRNGRKKEDAS